MNLTDLPFQSNHTGFRLVGRLFAVCKRIWPAKFIFSYGSSERKCEGREEKLGDSFDQDSGKVLERITWLCNPEEDKWIASM